MNVETKACLKTWTCLEGVSTTVAQGQNRMKVSLRAAELRGRTGTAGTTLSKRWKISWIAFRAAGLSRGNAMFVQRIHGLFIYPFNIVVN